MKTRSIYGQKRVLTRLEHAIDPLVLAGIDELAARRGISRAQCVRDALYSAVYCVLREGRGLRSAPMVPFKEGFEGLPRCRIVDGRLVSVDRFGLPGPVKEASL